MRMEKGRIFFTNHREFSGIEMVALQTVGDVTDGIKMPVIKVKSQCAQHGYDKFRTGIGLAYFDLDVQRCQQGGQMVVDIAVGLFAHGGEDLLNLVPLTGGQRQAVHPRICCDAVVAVPAGMFPDKAAIERGPVKTPREGVEIAQIVFCGDGYMIIGIPGNGPYKPSHAVWGSRKHDIQVFLLRLQGIPPKNKILNNYIIKSSGMQEVSREFPKEIPGKAKRKSHPKRMAFISGDPERTRTVDLQRDRLAC